MDNNETIDLRLLVELAHMYYIDGSTQQDIAERFFISRSLVSKYLAKAREAGVVEIVIHEEEIQPYRDIEMKIKEQFVLTEVICVNTVENSTNLKKRLGNAAAKYFTRVIQPNQSIGISAGSTLLEMARAISPYAKFNSNVLVPLAGGLGSQYRDIHAHVICEIIASKSAATNLELFAPLIVDSKQSKSVFYKQPFILDVIEKAKNVDIAFISAGANPLDNHITSFYLDDAMGDFKEVEQLANLVGDMSYIFVDAYGNQIDCEWNDRLIGLEMDDLRNINKVVMIAGGTDKFATILAACRSGVIDVLITDVNIGKRLINQ